MRFLAQYLLASYRMRKTLRSDIIILITSSVRARAWYVEGVVNTKKYITKWIAIVLAPVTNVNGYFTGTSHLLDYQTHRLYLGELRLVRVQYAPSIRL